MPFPCTEKAAAGSGPAAAFRALGGAGVVGVVLRVAEFDCVLQLVDPRVGEVRDLRDRQKVIAAECGSAIPGGAALEPTERDDPFWDDFLTAAPLTAFSASKR